MSGSQQPLPWAEAADAPAAPPAPPAAISAPLTKSNLKARGWTDEAIRRFLGEPDERREGARGSYRWVAHLYLASRVAAAEALPDFVSWRAERQERGDRARRAADRAAAARVEAARAWEPRIIRRPLAEVRLSAIAHYNERLARRCARAEEWGYESVDELPPPATEDSAPAFLDRIAVNYVRHRLTAYDGKMRALTGKQRGEEAIRLLRLRVLDAIAKAYPELAEEARRQRARREGTK